LLLLFLFQTTQLLNFSIPFILEKERERERERKKKMEEKKGGKEKGVREKRGEGRS
jgi:hypothetical protein